MALFFKVMSITSPKVVNECEIICRIIIVIEENRLSKLFLEIFAWY